MFFTLIDPFTDIHGSWRIFYTFTANAEKGARGVDHNRHSLQEHRKDVKAGARGVPRTPALLQRRRAADPNDDAAHGRTTGRLPRLGLGHREEKPGP